MGYLVRKITRSKWPEEVIPVNDMPADVISSELRTQRNTLSFWRIESLDEIDKAVLALAASSNSKHIEKIDVVCIPEEEIRSSSIEMNEDSPGDTIVSDLVELHRDLCSINYQTLGVISSLINNYMHRDLHKKFSRKQVKDYLLQAYRDNRICKDMCNDSLLSEIEAMV